MSVSPVRLIGGISDGEVIKVDDDQIEIVRSKARPVPVISCRSHSIEAFNRVIDTSRYIRCFVRTPDGYLYYFALDTMSDLEALTHVLGP